MFDHEVAWRGKERLEQRAGFVVAVCGAGAIGSNLAETLARQGFSRLRVIDFDRVERHNVPTQTYGTADVGTLKVKALQNRIFRDLGVRIEASNERVDARTVKVLAGAQLVVDAFDNAAGRRVVGEYCTREGIPCVHAGLSGDGFAEVKWNEDYKPPAEETRQLDPCEVPLARNLVVLAVAVLAEVVARFADRGERLVREVTLEDLAAYDPARGGTPPGA
jgi:predicted ThiF/HesA family dinucleotide-utilizing enzyme